MIKYFKPFFLISFFILSTSLYSRDKNFTSFKVTNDSIEFDEYVIDTGSLVNFISNNTSVSSKYNEDYYTFTIGDYDENVPSMNWKVGGYDLNSYLNFGAFIITHNHNTIRFNTNTSNDFKVKLYDFDSQSDIFVSFSMTDELAEPEDRVGVKCICKALAWENKLINDFIIYEYSIINNSGSIFRDVYTGFHIDGEISSPAAGSGVKAYYNDDMVDYYLGRDINGNTESISYIYDADSPYIDGDDTGGILNPKESLGYVGSRVLKCPPSKNGVAANQQSGHQWFNWYYYPDIDIGYDFYYLMKLEEFNIPRRNPMDYTYLQSLGPWDIDVDDTLVVAFALGIGNGLDGLRQNLQYAYDLYKIRDLGPQITYFSPAVDTIVMYIGETIKFCIEGADNILYRWGFNDNLLGNYDSTYTFIASKFHLGKNIIMATVSDNQYTRSKRWVLIVKAAKKYDLFQNYPNPFNGVTTIPFELQKDGNVEISIYDILGRKVKTLINKPYTFGKHTITWDGTNANGKVVSSGIYFYQIKSMDFISLKRSLFIK
jgi:type IX secretion system substrate protein